MNTVCEIIGDIDRAFAAFLSTEIGYDAAKKTAECALLRAVNDAEALLSDSKTFLSVDEAVALAENLHDVCEHFLVTGSSGTALAAFRLQYQLPAHIDLSRPDSGELCSALSESLDHVFPFSWNEKQREPFIDAALSAGLGSTPEAMTLRSRLTFMKAEALMHSGECDAALLCLTESYSSLADSVLQGAPEADLASLRILRNIRRCLEAKKASRLACRVQRTMDRIKARCGETSRGFAGSRPGDSPLPLKEGWPCAAFAMQDAQAAYDHLSGFKRVQSYGEGRQGHWYYTWDEGYRYLAVCAKCHGYVLVQRSEAHGEEDCYYGDYFPVTGPGQAEALNEQFDGWEIEERFNGKYLAETNGRVSWYDFHLRTRPAADGSRQ